MRPCILTIAGSDSGGGAGIQSDSRVIATLGGYALSVISAVTAQNGLGVRDWEPVRERLLRSQLLAVFEGFPVTAVKTGLLPGRKAVEAVAALLPEGLPLVVDPILGSTSGTRFLDRAGCRVLVKNLFPRASLVTPNWPEAEALTGLSIHDVGTAQAAAARLVDLGAKAVLVKGGHGKGPLVEDVLLTAEGVCATFASARIQTLNTHGTGCVLSAAIATALGRGVGLVPAIEQARRFLSIALEQGAEARWQGRGPAFSGW
ncbi:bifunctional hydroxymethylpyrimidine kinase/phosphomethylpyrimidine kinase [Nibricoccus sp. IMCC34717]|uniref:bifunctional hydroxymethylpyrimidine kinase/phosphomethylpyrimidine kinase n=1 Tax=Nibricoccus sp. IMCC34717 TaxID=3034021 RepID=UPI00384DD1E7